MFGKKTDWMKVLIGVTLMSPADEAAIAAITGGAGLAAAPAQGPLTFILGAAMVADGIGLIR